MKFPVDIKKFIQTQETLEGRSLPPSARELCERFLRASNTVYYRALYGEISGNPFDGDIAENMRRIWKERNEEEPCNSTVIFEIIAVLKTWGEMAFEQGVADRKETSA